MLHPKAFEDSFVSSFCFLQVVLSRSSEILPRAEAIRPPNRSRSPVGRRRGGVDATAAETLRNLGPESLRGAWNRRNSLYLPCLIGISPQRRVRPSPPTAIESLESETSSSNRRPARKNTRFRAVLSDGRWAMANPNRRRLVVLEERSERFLDALHSCPHGRSVIGPDRIAVDSLVIAAVALNFE